MRRIIVDRARGKKCVKRGGGRLKVELNDALLAVEVSPENLLVVDEALTRLAEEDPEAAQLVKLAYYGGLSVEQAGEALGVSRRGAYRHWAFARAWLYAAVAAEADPTT